MLASALLARSQPVRAGVRQAQNLAARLRPAPSALSQTGSRLPNTPAILTTRSVHTALLGKNISPNAFAAALQAVKSMHQHYVSRQTRRPGSQIQRACDGRLGLDGEVIVHQPGATPSKLSQFDAGSIHQATWRASPKYASMLAALKDAAGAVLPAIYLSKHIVDGSSPCIGPCMQSSIKSHYSEVP